MVRTAVGVRREVVVWVMWYRERERERATSLCIFPKDSSAGAGAWWERELDVCGDGQGCWEEEICGDSVLIECLEAKLMWGQVDMPLVVVERRLRRW